MMELRLLPAMTVLLLGVQSQNLPQSPCPNIFQYEPPGSEQGRWYGVVTLSTDITLHGLWLNIVLDNKADILGNWVGDVTTTDNMDFKIENTKMKVQPGPAQTVRFFVQYNTINKVPKLLAIRLNGREICSASTPLPAIDRPADTYTARPYDDKPSRRPDTESSSRPGRPSSSDQIKPEDRPVSRPIQGRPNTEGPVYVPTQGSNDEGNANPYSIGGGDVSMQSVGTQTDKNRPYSISRPQTTGTPSLYSGSGAQTSSGSQTSSFGTQTSSYGGQGSNSFGSQGSNSFGSQGSSNFGSQGSNSFGSNRPNSEPEVYAPGGSGNTDFTDYTDTESSDDYFGGGLPSITSIHRPSSNSGNKRQDQCGKVVRNATPLIVNGRPTMEGQWPWQIALYQTQSVDSKYICGGTLVSRTHVITAAHCVTRKGSPKVVNKNTLTVYLGKHNLRTSTDGVQIKFVGHITVHPQYNATSFSRDVGILKLKQPAEITEYVRTACLWPDDQIDLSFVIGKRGSVVGWGFDDKGVATEELTLVEMPVVEQETCIRSYSEFFARFTSEYTYCAGYRDGTSVCNGDSGGGMVFKIGDHWHLRGLVSLSVARQNEFRCDPSHYVVFTDLAKFLSWIKSVVTID